jgi:ATP-binding cassette subfamily B protein
LSTVRRADVIYVMDGGRIVEQGPHDALRVAGGPYAALWQLQTGERAGPLQSTAGVAAAAPAALRIR